MEHLYKVSNPPIVLEQLKKHYRKELLPSTRKDKKYMVERHGKYIHFGSLLHEDYTKHKDEDRRLNYLKRATKIKGDWKTNAFSPNFLSIILLWNGYEYLQEMCII